MKILCVADTENRAIWDGAALDRVKDADLILSCGDLSAAYLEYLVTMASCPLLYVCGNHDDRFEKEPPEGCIGIDDDVYIYRGVRIAGLGGSARYKPGPYMYTEKEMSARIRRLSVKFRLGARPDILVTHAPPRGCGDREDPAHQGFECFNDLLMKYQPKYLLHGHVHKDYGGFVRTRTHESGTTVINCCDYYLLEVPEGPENERRGIWRLIQK